MTERFVRWIPVLTPRRREQIWYGPLLATAMALSLVRLLAYARFLSVDEFGFFSAGLLVSSSFCMLGCFGLMPMLQREWPVFLVHGQCRRGWTRAAQCGLVAIVSGTSMAAMSVTGWHVAGLMGGALGIAVFHGVTQQLFLVVTTESRSAGDALRYALHQLLRGLTSCAAGLTLVLNGYGAVGLMVAEAVVALLAAVAIVLHGGRRGRPPMALLAKLVLRGLAWIPWRTALTMMAVMLVSFAMVNIDRWFASHTLDAANFGRYAFAAIALSVAQACQALINASGYPLIARRQATQGLKGAFRVSMKLSVAVACVGAAVLAPAAWLAQAGLVRWYPDYAAVGPLLPWLGLIGLVRAADFWSSFLIISGHESTVLRLNVASAVAALLLWLVWSWQAPDLAMQPAGCVALAGLVTALGSASTFLAAWQAGHRPQVPAQTDLGAGHRPPAGGR